MSTITNKEVTVTKVTPAMAEAWLNKHNTNNRKLRQSVAERYAADMMSGNWTSCTEPIGFFEDGELANGQHRLWAVVLSGKAQSFIIVRNLDRRDGLNIDTGFSRTVTDAAHIAGLEIRMSTIMVSTARACEEARESTRGMSHTEKIELVKRTLGRPSVVAKRGAAK